MKPQLIYYFEWDDLKALGNIRKHGVDFESATAVLRDPLALTRHDVEHSETQDHWVTLGEDESGALLVVIHTFQELSDHETLIRVISARKATTRERWQYETDKYSVQEAHDMESEYDFSNAKRGKFYRGEARFERPLRLQPELVAFFRARAAEQGVETIELLNEALRHEMQRMQAGV